MADAGEVRDLVLRQSLCVQSFNCVLVHTGDGVVGGNNFGVVARTSGKQFPSQAGFVIDFEHVNTGMGDARGDEGRERLLPGDEGLARQAGDEVEVDIGDAGGPETGEVVKDNGAGMKPAALVSFAIDERLNSETDAVDTGAHEGRHGLIRELAGGTFDRDLGVGVDGELGADGSEELVDEIWFEQAGSSAAEIDSVNATGQVRAEALAPSSSIVHVGGEAIYVSRVIASGKDARGKVTVSALRAAERDGDVKAELIAAGCCHTQILSCPRERQR